MSRFYGTLSGSGSGRSTRTGTTKTGIRASAQTKKGSLIACAFDCYGEDTFSLEISDTTSHYGRTIFTGTLQELESLLER